MGWEEGSESCDVILALCLFFLQHPLIFRKLAFGFHFSRRLASEKYNRFQNMCLKFLLQKKTINEHKCIVKYDDFRAIHTRLVWGKIRKI